MISEDEKLFTNKRPKKTVYMVEARDKEDLLSKKDRDILEAEVEAYLCRRAKEMQLDILKLNPQSCKGIPDRLIFDPKGVANPHFVETKRNQKAKVQPLQVYLSRGLRSLFIKSKDDVETFLWKYYPDHYLRDQAIKKEEQDHKNTIYR